MNTFIKVFIVHEKRELGGRLSTIEYGKTSNEINEYARSNKLEIVSIYEHQPRVIWVIFRKVKEA